MNTLQSLFTSLESRFDEQFPGFVASSKEMYSPRRNVSEMEIVAFIKQSHEEIIQAVVAHLKPCQDYCIEVNGRSDCKNCGFDLDDLKALLSPKKS